MQHDCAAVILLQQSLQVVMIENKRFLAVNNRLLNGVSGPILIWSHYELGAAAELYTGA